jgi:hypothetical protein
LSISPLVTVFLVSNGAGNLIHSRRGMSGAYCD